MTESERVESQQRQEEVNTVSKGKWVRTGNSYIWIDNDWEFSTIDLLTQSSYSGDLEIQDRMNIKKPTHDESTQYQRQKKSVKVARKKSQFT